MMKFLRRAALTLAVLGSPLPALSEVRVWQGTLSLPTYEEGPPDENPPFDQLSTGRFNYPYTLRMNLTDRRAVHNWRAIFLENEYLKCSVLPDLGGHLYTCVDKINGKPMFYPNPSIKKANIGYRGAWAAFGIEHNFPVSHNWVSLSPVDFAFSPNADGSASVTVGNVDRVYGMEWSVEMVLRPKSTVLEERVMLNNRSDIRHRFYWWNNAAIEVWDDSRIEYPMRFAASHGFTEVKPWPFDASGRDLSVIRNQTDGPVSLFVYASREPFMGVWNPHTNSGTVHFANYDEVPGKKTWSWGANADALDWRKALSDDNSAYVEVQAGLFRNQETYGFFEPRQTMHFSEYWMPARGIGGITRANLAGVLALRREGNALFVGFNANRPIPGAVISVLDRDKKVWSERSDLVPEHTWSRAVSLSDPQEKYTIEIRDPTGIHLRQTEGEYDWTPNSEIKAGQQPSYKIPDRESRTEGDWLRLGENQELNGRLLAALDSYHELLRRSPNSYEGWKAAGRLSATLLHYQNAVELLGPACERNTSDAEAAYYLGIAYDGLEREGKAREAFEAAYRLPQWRAAAALRLAELSARAGDLDQSEHYLEQAKSSSPDDLRVREELVAVERTLGHDQQAQSLAKDGLARFPLSWLLQNELGKVDLEELANNDTRILNMAAEYMHLGMYESALDVLSKNYPDPVPDQSEPGAPSPLRDPMIAYYRAYCRAKMGQSPADDSKTASLLPTQYIFPTSADDLAVLRAAVARNGGDAKARYLLGTLYFSHGLADQALGEWRLAKESQPSIPMLDAGLGVALLHAKNDPEAALQSFRQGLRNDPENDALYLGADQSLSLLGKPSAERVAMFESYPDVAKMPAPLVFELALNLSESRDSNRALALFHNRFFPREEGGTNVRQVWVEVKLQRALNQAQGGQCSQALSTASSLSSPVKDASFTSDGLTPFVDSARTNYLLGKIEARCGDPQRAREHFENASARSRASEIVWAWLAANQLPGFDASDWAQRLKSALEQSESMSETGTLAGWWAYNTGMLDRALGRERDAREEFHKALLLPDFLLSYHLTREALAQP